MRGIRVLVEWNVIIDIECRIWVFWRTAREW